MTILILNYYSGVKEVIKKRLKNYYKKQKIRKDIKPGSKKTYQRDYYCIIDFEATCEEKNPDNYVHEIIEFPAVLVDGKTLELVWRVDFLRNYILL